MAMDLFDTIKPAFESLPLAERLRPRSLEKYRGQKKVLKTLQPFLGHPERLPNIILWGPPGCGKTTLARIIAESTDAQFVNLNAVETGAKEIRELGARAHQRKISGQITLIFIDEIHRLNRAQQDVLLPFTEAGDFILVGATTENPSYEMNSALLSRARVIVLDRLEPEELDKILEDGARELGVEAVELLTPEGRATILDFSDGDARKLLSAIEILAAHFKEWGEELNQTKDPVTRVKKEPFTRAKIAEVLQKPTLRYDKKSDEHYDTISAFIKSIRGSSPDAAVYYLARMLAGGEDPVFIARRLVILASEDIGNADPRALQVAVSGLQAVELVGMPEAAISLSQVVTYLSSVPKSNASYVAIKSAQALVERTGTLPIPLALRSSKTKLNKQQGYGEGYKYAHDGATGWQEMEFLPEEIRGTKFYDPVDRGFEKTMKQYLDWMTGKGKG